MAVAVDRTVNEFRRYGAQRLVTQPQAVEYARPEILDDGVGLRAQLAQPLDLRRVLEIDRDAALVAIDRCEVFTVLGAMIARAHRRPAPHVVAAVGPLDLDHVGAEVGEQRSGERPGGDLPEFEYLQARQRAACSLGHQGVRRWTGNIYSKPGKGRRPSRILIRRINNPVSGAAEYAVSLGTDGWPQPRRSPGATRRLL